MASVGPPTVVLPDELETGDGRAGMRPVAAESISSGNAEAVVLRWESALGPSVAPTVVIGG